MTNLLRDGGFMIVLGIILLAFFIMLLHEQGPIDRAAGRAEKALQKRGYRIHRGVVIREK